VIKSTPPSPQYPPSFSAISQASFTSNHFIILKFNTFSIINVAMDVAYNQHSPHARHQSRSSANLNHLTLAPLTPRLPLSVSDQEDLDHARHVSYLEGRSAPTTPSILSRSSSRISMRRPINTGLAKSKSSIHLPPNSQPRSGTTTPKLRRGVTREGLSLSTLSPRDGSDSDWLLRAGTAISSSTRESKGQAWLVSRASSTSLSRKKDEEEEALDQELAKAREQASRRGSRRGSIAIIDVDADDEFSPATARRSLSFEIGGSRSVSRFGSRVQSRRGSRSQLPTPGMERDGYFNHQDITQGHFVAEPDFVGVEDDVLEDEVERKDDEAVVRTLAKANSLGFSGWVEKMLGWSLFPVDEDGEDTDSEMLDEKESDSDVSSRSLKKIADAMHDTPPSMPPLGDDEAGGWQDAAWLLSVATKVLL